MHIEAWHRIDRLVSIIAPTVRLVFCDYNLFTNNHYHIRSLSVSLFSVNDNLILFDTQCTRIMFDTLW